MPVTDLGQQKGKKMGKGRETTDEREGKGKAVNHCDRQVADFPPDKTLQM